jgi:putative transposase of IS4/5 family DUF4096
LPVPDTTPERPLPTTWELPDELWERIEPILLRRYPIAPTGRPRADLRLVLDAIVYRMRSGVQWNRVATLIRGGLHRPRLVPALRRRRCLGGGLGRLW